MVRSLEGTRASTCRDTERTQDSKHSRRNLLPTEEAAACLSWPGPYSLTCLESVWCSSGGRGWVCKAQPTGHCTCVWGACALTMFFCLFCSLFLLNDEILRVWGDVKVLWISSFIKALSFALPAQLHGCNVSTCHHVQSAAEAAALQSAGFTGDLDSCPTLSLPRCWSIEEEVERSHYGDPEGQSLPS